MLGVQNHAIKFGLQNKKSLYERRFCEICNNLSDRARRVVILYHPRYSIDPNFKVVDLIISGQYVLIYGITNLHERNLRERYQPLDRRPIELWKLNSIQSVRIPLPDHKLYLTEDDQKFFYDGRRGSRYYTVADTRCKWLLDPSSTPKYLVGIVATCSNGSRGFS